MISKQDYENEKEKISQNQKRLDEIENRLNGEYTNEKEKISQNQKRLDEIENHLNILENEMRLYRRNMELLFSKKNDSCVQVFNFLDKKTNSQCGEDAILAYVISRLGIPFEACRYLDLGANRPVEGSNTNFFYQQGATGVLVEANPELIKDLEEQREGDIILNKCIDVENDTIMHFYIMSDDGLSTPNFEQVEEIQRKNPNIFLKDTVEVKSISVNSIFERYFPDKIPEILSVDVEGKDLEILQSIDFSKYRPLLIVVEMIEYSPDKIPFQKNEKVLDMMRKHGYFEYAFTGVNSIFIDKTSPLVNGI